MHRRLNAVGDVVVHECGPPCMLRASERLPPALQGIHLITDPCTVAVEASAAQTARADRTRSVRASEAAAPGAEAESLMPPPTVSNALNPPRTRTRREDDTSLRDTSQPGVLRLTHSVAAPSVKGRPQAAVRQADGILLTSLPVHCSMAAAAVRRHLRDAAGATLSGANADSELPADTLASEPAAGAAAAADAAAWQPRGWFERGGRDLADGASRHVRPAEPATGSASTSAGLGAQAFAVSDSVREATAEALTAALLPLTASELALVVRRDSRAASNDAGTELFAPLQPLLQVNAV